jgi:Rieske Fe-S protein
LKIRNETGVLLDLRNGEGGVFNTEDGKLAAFRNWKGELRTFDAVCPHMRCIVHWNAFEESFDCPCHGSRFNNFGKCIEGPSLRGLTPKSLKRLREENP